MQSPAAPPHRRRYAEAGTTAYRGVIDVYHRQRGSRSTGVGFVRTRLGACLTAQGRYAEAEAMLLERYGVLAQSPISEEEGRDALRDLVVLYTAWHRPAQAARYRALLAAKR